MTGAFNTARSTSWGRSPGSVSETTPPSLVSQKPTAAPNGSSAPSKSNASGPNCTTPSTTSARLSRPGPRPTTTNGSSNATATRPHEKHSPQPKARWQHETDTNAVQRTGCCSSDHMQDEDLGFFAAKLPQRAREDRTLRGGCDPFNSVFLELHGRRGASKLASVCGHAP